MKRAAGRLPLANAPPGLRMWAEARAGRGRAEAASRDAALRRLNRRAGAAHGSQMKVQEWLRHREERHARPSHCRRAAAAASVPLGKDGSRAHRLHAAAGCGCVARLPLGRGGRPGPAHGRVPAGAGRRQWRPCRHPVEEHRALDAQRLRHLAGRRGVGAAVSDAGAGDDPADSRALGCQAAVRRQARRMGAHEARHSGRSALYRPPIGTGRREEQLPALG